MEAKILKQPYTFCWRQGIEKIFSDAVLQYKEGTPEKALTGN
tara:strand:- start:1440 stop:1565 length:126 start_codon:yes stop_codon:yes gene_type:complete